MERNRSRETARSANRQCCRSVIAALAMLMCWGGATASAQIATQSFETIISEGSQYFDTLGADNDHALPNHSGEATMNNAGGGSLVGFSSFYVNSMGDVGLTEGDFVGVQSFLGDVSAYTDGVQGFEFSDTDGTLRLDFSAVDLSSVGSAVVLIDVFIAATSWETGGTQPIADAARIWVTGDAATVDLLNTTGSDINDLGIEGGWMTISADLSAFDSAVLHAELTCNAASEWMYIDNIRFLESTDCNTNGVADVSDIDSGAEDDCNTNGVPDICDISLGSSMSPDCDTNDVPDECQPDCNTNGTADTCDIADMPGSDCNTNDMPDICEPGGILDCNTNGITDACDNPADCNNNGVLDACDLANASSDDCNMDGIPDECLGGDLDCNTNGGVDVCDVASGSALDCNTNGVPDECEVNPIVTGDSMPNAVIVVTGTGTDDTITLASSDSTADVNVRVQINHLWASDLDISLLHSGLTIDLSSDNGGGGAAAYEDTTFDDEALDSIAIASAPFIGAFRPEQPLSAFDGSAAGGDWTLRVHDDNASGTTGTLLAWSIRVEGVPDDCNDNGVVDACDIDGATSTDCNTNGVPDDCEGGAGDCNTNGTPDACDEGGDCNTNGLLDACDIADGANDCDSNGVPDECEDCNTNGEADFCDIDSGASDDCNSNDVPDECELVDCNTNGALDACDVGDMSSPDCNTNGVPDECDSASLADCNTNGILDFCETPVDCNSNGVPDECEAGGAGDCNTNGIVDACDVFDDCNANGVADVCDLANGTSDDIDMSGVPDECEDCNSNGLVDSIDIAEGSSTDCNTNDLPDDCEFSDCNNNGLNDACDIAGNTSDDCDGNGLPDECNTFVLARTSFEAPAAVGGPYVDTGDANVDHALVNNDGQPFVNFSATGGEMGYSAFYTNSRNDVGLTDGDFVGVTGFTGDVGAFTDGVQGYQFSDCDGLMTLTFDTVDLTGTSDPSVALDLWVIETGYETAPEDRIRAWVVVDGGVEIDLLSTGGTDINALGIEGFWMTLSTSLSGYTTATLKVECDSNAATEGIYVDNVVFTETQADCNTNGLIDACEGSDCDSNGILDVCETNINDCNTNGLIDECEGGADCNTNGTLDACEGGFADCNTNGVADFCDAGDCNGNGAPDACDIAGMTSDDCNSDGIPDECQLTFDFITGVSFEAPGVVTVQYVDTGDAGTDHALVNNAGEPFVNFPASGGELGFSAFYTNTRDDVGLTEGDFVGVTNFTGTVGAYTDGAQGYQLSDCDGMVTVSIDAVDISSVSMPRVSIDVYVQNTGYETGDHVRVWVEVDGGAEIEMLLADGDDIELLGAVDDWMTLTADLTGNSTATLRFELDSNAATEALFIDNIRFESAGGDDNGNGILDVCEQEGCDLPGDMNDDDLIDGDDVQGFIDCYFADVGGAPSVGCECADIDGSGTLDGTDVSAFVALLLS